MQMRLDGNAPIDTIISALIVCITISIATILKRMYEIFLDINVRAKWVEKQDPPEIFENIDLEYIVRGVVSKSGIEKAIDFTFKKYSPSVIILQRSGIKLNVSFIV